mgnify:CR=1 FL=1
MLHRFGEFLLKSSTQCDACYTWREKCVNREAYATISVSMERNSDDASVNASGGVFRGILILAENNNKIAHFRNKEIFLLIPRNWGIKLTSYNFKSKWSKNYDLLPAMTHKKDGIIDLLFCGFDYLRISRVRQLMFFLGFSSSDTGCPSKFLIKYTYSAIFQSSEKLGEVGLCLQIFGLQEPHLTFLSFGILHSILIKTCLVTL